MFVDRKIPFRESPLFGHDDFLSSRELELGSSEGFDHVLLVRFLGADREHHLVDVDTSHSSQRLPIGSAHARLESVSSSTREHFVDSKNMEGMESNSHMEGILATSLDEILVRTDSSCFQSFT